MREKLKIHDGNTPGKTFEVKLEYPKQKVATMSELKCPFCQQELHKDPDGYYTCYTDNCGCWANGENGASGSESLWLTLIRTRKALDAAKEGLKRIDWCATDYGVAQDILDEITALEQKD